MLEPLENKSAFLVETSVIKQDGYRFIFNQIGLSQQGAFNQQFHRQSCSSNSSLFGVGRDAEHVAHGLHQAIQDI